MCKTVIIPSSATSTNQNLPCRSRWKNARFYIKALCKHILAKIWKIVSFSNPCGNMRRLQMIFPKIFDTILKMQNEIISLESVKFTEDYIKDIKSILHSAKN